MFYNANNFKSKRKNVTRRSKSHEQICIEKYSNYANQSQDNQLKQICKANEQNWERNHLDTINQLLSGNIPQINAQQNQNAAQNMNTTVTAVSNIFDRICVQIY